MDQKKGGLLQRAMPPKPTEGSRIRPLASTYNVMITLVYPFFFGSSTDGRPSKSGGRLGQTLNSGPILHSLRKLQAEEESGYFEEFYQLFMAASNSSR